MKLSQYFLPLIKENPSEAQVASHRLMLKSGMIKQVTSGIYSWLPIGLRVLKKVENIVRDEMNKAGANEILMPMTQPAELWHESGRYDAYGKEMLRFKDRHDRDMLFGPTHEEVVTDIFRSYIKSYKELPQNLYQIHWKFRDEIRPRFGVMRGREFLMKDSYSFDLDFASAKKTYDRMYKAYLNIFERLGAIAIPVSAETGAIGGSMSHEFQILADTGESEIYYEDTFEDIISGKKKLEVSEMQSLYAAADEMHVPEKLKIPESRVRSRRGIEVGHIFYLGTKYSTAMNAFVTDKNGEKIPAEMGCYGIGVSRVVAAIIEANHDDNGIIWTDSVAPFKLSLINLRPNDEDCIRVADSIYSKLQELGVEVLYDDTDNTAGSKFATADLIGTTWHLAIGPRGVKAGTIEVKNRKTSEKQELSIESALSLVITS